MNYYKKPDGTTEPTDILSWANRTLNPTDLTQFIKDANEKQSAGANSTPELTATWNQWLVKYLSDPTILPDVDPPLPGAVPVIIPTGNTSPA